MRNEYVLGLMFDPSLECVALIRKNRPAWQAGLFNGIGGKVEREEEADPYLAMVREFSEETGVRFLGWRAIALLEDKRWAVHVYGGVSEAVFDLESKTDEHVQLFDVDDLPTQSVPNVPWLVPFARYAMRPGSDLVHADVWFDFAPDPRIMEAAKLFDVSPDQVTEEQRTQAKELWAVLGLSA